MTSHIFHLLLRSLRPFVTQVLVPSHQCKPNFDDRTIFPRTTTTRPLASLRIPSCIDSQEISLWINPFNEIAPIRSSQLFPSGRRQTSHIHRSPHRLRPAVWLLRHSALPKLAVTSFPTFCVSLHTWYTTQRPQTLPVIRSNRYPQTQPSHRVNYPSCVSIRSSSSPWAAATSHIQMYPSLIALL